MSTTTGLSPSARVRKELGHPVVDGDAHLIEAEPILFDYVREIAGPAVVDRCRANHAKANRWFESTAAQRQHERMVRPPWGMRSKSMRDLATVMLPKMLYERLDDMGIDYCIVLPTVGLFLSRQRDDEARRLASRAVNVYLAEMYKGLGDRLCPGAVIPMRTPEEALEELEHAVVQLGHKVVVIDSGSQRAIPSIAEALAAHPELEPLAARAGWVDCYGLDSAYDYDPVWKRCEELGVAVCGHTGGHWGSRTSPSNYVHNHLGLFAAGGDSLCRALLLGGVMTRFPKLQVGFLEGGVAWAASLLCDVIEHWEKRRGSQLDHFDRKHIDVEELRGWWRKYGAERLVDAGSLEEAFPIVLRTAAWHGDYMNDELAGVAADTKKQIRDQFARRFYFGCEADDKMIATAFDERILGKGTKLRAFFGSDIGHWDVEDLEGIVAEAHSYLVRTGLVAPDDFRRFLFDNAVRFHGGSNPKFFEGTVVEKEARAVLESMDD